MTTTLGAAVAASRRRGGRRRPLVFALLTLVAILAAGWFALQRGDLPWSMLDAKYAGPASRWMDLPGGLRVHYRDEGRRDGPPLVLVHGFSASVIDWDRWVQQLRTDHRIITLDLPGHGLTRAPPGYAPGRNGYAAVVDGVTRGLGVERFALAGNSMGGGVALRYAITHPERLSALVLVDAAGWPERAANRGSPLIFKILGNPVGRLLIKNLDVRSLTERGLRDAYLEPRLVTPALVDRYVELSRAPGHRDILLSRQGAGDGPTLAEIAGVRVPTLVMHGRQDRLIPFSAAEGFARTISGAKLVAYDKVGHVPMEQIPERSAADLRTFLSSVGAAGPRPAPG